MSPHKSNGLVESATSISCAVPSTEIITVEHPGIIKNIGRGIESLGGEKGVNRFIRSPRPNRFIGLYLTPEDPFRKPIQSDLVSTSNVLLKVSLPKRTGRKRKRGDTSPFVDSNDDPLSVKSICREAHTFLRSLRDNSEKYKVCAIGRIEETHRFRALPDFQWSLESSTLATDIKEKLLSLDYEKMKEFKLDLETQGVQPDMDMIPPPSFWQGNLPFNYAYRQNPAVKITKDDTGRQMYMNTSRIPRTRTIRVDCNVDKVPSEPPKELPSMGSLSEDQRAIVQKLRDLLDQCPVVTRRVVVNTISTDLQYNLRQAVQFCGYMFKSGPWCHCIVKYGVDPRSDPGYREYQALSFQIPIREADNSWSDQRQRYHRLSQGKPREVDSHFFDGKKVVQDSKTWQICHITDPLLRQLIDSDQPRSMCETRQDGWFTNGLMAKVRIIMRDKITAIMDGKVPDDSLYERLLVFPNVVTLDNLHLLTLHHPQTTQKEFALAELIRNMAKDSCVKVARVAEGKRPHGSSKKNTSVTGGRHNDRASGQAEEEFDEDLDDGDDIIPMDV